MLLFFKYQVVDTQPWAHPSVLCHKSLVILFVLRNIVVLGVGVFCLFFSVPFPSSSPGKVARDICMSI